MSENKGFLYRTLEAVEKNISAVVVLGLLSAGTIGAGVSAFNNYRESQLEIERIKAGLELKVGDFNGNSELDKFYEIGGQKVPVEVDGRPVAEYF